LSKATLVLITEAPLVYELIGNEVISPKPKRNNHHCKHHRATTNGGKYFSNIPLVHKLQKE
jgi:hypothetical protein